jgi:hypothetical protein
MSYDGKFEPRPDSGSLNATKAKKSPKAADYFGEIAINMSDMTNIRIENGLTIVKLSGWKKTSKSGVTYLSLAVNRYVPEGQPRAPVNDDIPDF